MNAFMQEFLQAVQTEVARRFSSGKREIFIWGAGGAGRAAATVLHSRAISWVGFIDRDPAKEGSILEGKPVYRPEELQRRTMRPRILIASMYHQEIENQLKNFGFRPPQDFQIFPNDEVGFSRLGGGIKIYNLWRHLKLEHEGYISAGMNSLPPIRLIRLKGPISPGPGISDIEKQLPRNDKTWVCLYGSGCRAVKWYWHKIESNRPDAEVADVSVEFLPSGRNGSSPLFSTSFFTLAPSFSDRIVACRTRLVHDFLSEIKNSPRTIGDLKAWLVNRTSVSQAKGICQISLDTTFVPSLQTQHKNTRNFSLLQDFIRDLGTAGIPLLTANEAARELSGKIDSNSSENNGIEFLYAKFPKKRKLKIQILAHSQGNFFFSEIRDFLAACWRRAGAEVVAGNELSIRRGAPWRAVVIAPHEFEIFKDNSYSFKNGKKTVFINTEQPHTKWFSAALPSLLDSPLVFDLNWQTSLLLRNIGVNAHFLPLGTDSHVQITKPRQMMPLEEAVRGMSLRDRALPSSVRWEKRPIDILFVGTMSPRRDEFFALNAGIFAKHRCFFHIPPNDRPIRSESPDCLNSRAMADLCRRAKIVLNIHRDDLPYCEWHRIIFHALRQGALVVTEPMMPVPKFVAGRDFIVSPKNRLARKIDRILTTRTGRQQAETIAHCGALTYQDNFPALKIARRSSELFFSFGL